MQTMLYESRLQDCMFIHGSKEDKCFVRTLEKDRQSFTQEELIDLGKFNIVQLGVLLAQTVSHDAAYCFLHYLLEHHQVGDHTVSPMILIHNAVEE